MANRNTESEKEGIQNMKGCKTKIEIKRGVADRVKLIAIPRPIYWPNCNIVWVVASRESVEEMASWP